MGNDYGSVWSDAIRNIASILESGNTDEKRIADVFASGFFTQLTSYSDEEFNELVCGWYADFLKSQHAYDLASIPKNAEESKIVPKHLTFEKDGKNISSDMLRYTAYILMLKEKCGADFDKIGKVMEIGGGYGGFARIIKAFLHRRTSYRLDFYRH